ncbi:hypothetical protein AYI69_g10172, partial [Smittium culicis]
GLAPGSVYPLGSIISNQVTPSESRSDSPSFLSPSGSLSPVNKDKQSLLSSILSSENSFFDGNNSSTSSNNSNFDNSHSENNSYKTLADIKPNSVKGSSEISPFNGSHDKYLPTNSTNGVPITVNSKSASADFDLSKSDNSSICSFEKKINTTNSALGLSIEKIDKLELDGYGKVKVIQTKPALALSFTQPSNIDKLGKISAIKQHLTGLDTLRGCTWPTQSNSRTAVADDAVVLADSAENLQTSLDTISTWSDTWEMAVNASKCAIMAINCDDAVKMTLQRETIRTIDNYTYMDYIMNSKWG